jgi:hypothetical protein
MRKKIGLLGALISMAEIATEDMPEGSAAKRIRQKELSRVPHQGKREMERRRKRLIGKADAVVWE